MNYSEMEDFLIKNLYDQVCSVKFPIPSTWDNEMADFIDSYQLLENEKRKTIRNNIIEEHIIFFLTFARRMACLAVRKKSEKEIYRGIGALSLQAGLGDYRDDIVGFSLLYDAAIRIGIEPDKLFLNAVKDYDYPDISDIYSFINRSESNKSIEVMGFIEGADNDGFIYIKKESMADKMQFKSVIKLICRFFTKIVARQ